MTKLLFLPNGEGGRPVTQGVSFSYVISLGAFFRSSRDFIGSPARRRDPCLAQVFSQEPKHALTVFGGRIVVEVHVRGSVDSPEGLRPTGCFKQGA